MRQGWDVSRCAGRRIINGPCGAGQAAGVGLVDENALEELWSAEATPGERRQYQSRAGRLGGEGPHQGRGAEESSCLWYWVPVYLGGLRCVAVVDLGISFFMHAALMDFGCCFWIWDWICTGKVLDFLLSG